MLSIAGKTEDGKLVIAGCFKMYETEGIPLDIMFNIIKDKNGIPSWIDFHKDALSAGMQHSRILSMLDPAIMDSYGTEFKDETLKRLDSWFNYKFQKD